MNSQLTLWLYPLALVAALALVSYLRMGIRWTWGFCLQALSMLFVAVLGLVPGPTFVLEIPGGPLWQINLSSVCVFVGWGMFVLTVMVPRALLARLERQLVLLNPESALREARRLRWFFWGPPGRYWLDMASAMSLFIKGEAPAAEAVIEKWQSRPLPRQTREGLHSYLMTGRVILREWPSIIQEYEHLKEGRVGCIPYGASVAASRAYAEVGKIGEACKVLEGANLPACRVNDGALDLVFLPIFSLAGAQPECESLLKRLARGRRPLPACSQLYWTGRCLLARGQWAEARAAFQEALAKVPAGSSAWPDRIRFQLELLDQLSSQETAPTGAPDWSSELKRAEAVLRQSRLVADIVSPKGRCWAVRALVLLILLAYGVSHSFSIIRTPEFVRLSHDCFVRGVLDAPLVRSGEYWRLVSYLFLHAHISHLALNLIGLWWFGRMVENLYGTSRFLAIYFLSGILSGVAQVYFSPEMPAVGASGAVMGVFGAATAGVFRCKELLPDSIRKTEVCWMLGLALAQVLLDQMIPNVAVFAHIGGLVAGLLIGLVLPLSVGKLASNFESS